MPAVLIGDILPYTQSPATSMGQTVFMTNWTANFPSDVVVYYTPVGDEPNDVTQLLSYPSEYSVAFIGSQQDVQVTLVTGAINIGDIVTITRQTPADRENLYTNTNFVPSMLNNDFGILTLVDQQAQLVNQLIGPRYNYSAVITDVVDTILPILGPNQVWIKNGNNTAIVPVTISGGGSINGFINPGSANQIAIYENSGTTLTGTFTIPDEVISSITFLNGLTGYLSAPLGFADSDGNIALKVDYRVNAVNYLEINNAPTSGNPTIQANGSDSNIPFWFGAKNAGFVFYDTTQTISGTILFLNAPGTNFTSLSIAPNQSTSVNFILPATDGTALAPMVTDGAGNLSFLPGPWIDFSGTVAATGFVSPTFTTARWKQIGKTVFVSINMNGTSNATTFTITNLPVAVNASNTNFIGFQFCQNNNVNSICTGSITSTTLTLYQGTTSQVAGWANSGGKGFFGIFTYEAA